MEPTKKKLAEKDEEKVQSLGKDFLRQLAVIIRFAFMYEPTNSALAKPTKDFCVTVAEFITLLNTAISFKISGELAFIGSTLIKLDTDTYKYAQFIKQLFVDVNVGEITIDDKINEDELKTFVYYLVECQKDLTKKTSAHSKKFAKISLKEFVEENIEEISEEKTDPKKNILKVYSSAMLAIKEFVDGVKDNNPTPPTRIKRIIQEIVDLTQENQNIWIGLTFLQKYKKHLHCHLLNSSIISILLGRKLSLDRITLSDLGYSAIFYNLGRVDMPDEILNKKGALSLYETMKLRKMPIIAVQNLLKFKSFNESWISRVVVAFEAELNFRGEVPEGMATYYNKTLPSLFSRIISISATFDDLTCEKPNREPQLPDEAIRTMMEECGDKFDPLIFKLFVNIIGVYPIGSMVELDNGEVAVVFDLPKDAPDFTRPIIRIIMDKDKNRIDGEIIDLTLRDESGAYARSIIKGVDPAEFELNVPHFFLA